MKFQKQGLRMSHRQYLICLNISHTKNQRTQLHWAYQQHQGTEPGAEMLPGQRSQEGWAPVCPHSQGGGQG